MSEELSQQHEMIARTLADDFFGEPQMMAIRADAALSDLRASSARARKSPPTSPRRVVNRTVTAHPPSSMFPGDVGGGRLRWTEEKQWRSVQHELRALLQSVEEEAADARAQLMAQCTFAAMELRQEELSMRYAAARMERDRIERADTATWGVRYEPDSGDRTLERDHKGQPTHAAVRERKALLRLQRVGRGYGDRNGALQVLRAAWRAEVAAWMKRNAAARRLQRWFRVCSSRSQRRRRAHHLDAYHNVRVHAERRDGFALTVQEFVYSWFARHEAGFRASRHAEISAPSRPSYLFAMQQWLAARRAEYVDEDSQGDYFLLPPFLRTRDPTLPPVYPPGANLAACFDVRHVLVASELDATSEPFLSEWRDFTTTLSECAVSVVGLDAEWNGEHPPALLQICDTTRCFLLRLQMIPDEIVKPLLSPVLTSPKIFKCGVGIRHDRKKLEGAGYGPIAGLLDLVSAAAAVDLLPETGRSLEAVCAAATGLHMHKLRRVTTSDWEAPALSEEQLAYAADDAIAGIAIIAAALEKARRLKYLPPARDGAWTLRDDEAAYKWLALVASLKPPPLPQQKGGGASRPSRGRDGATNDESADGAASVPPRPRIPGPEDIHATEAKPLYDNIRVLSIQGRHIFTCDMKKAMWYTKKKKLATVTRVDENGKLAEIQLNFEPAAKTKLCMNWQLGSCSFGDQCLFAHGVEELVPAKNVPPLPVDGDYDDLTGQATPSTTTASGKQPTMFIAAAVPESNLAQLGGTANDPAAAAIQLTTLGRANACNVCLVTGALYTKFAILPSHYRRHLAPDLRRCRSFDYVPICSQCLPRVQATYNAERRRLWELALAAMDPADRDTRLSYSSATKLYRFCEILGSQKMSEIPAARQAEIEDIVLEAFPKALLPSPVQPDVEMEIPDLHDDATSRADRVQRVVKYVLSYDVQDWTHSTEAMDIISYWRKQAAKRSADHDRQHDELSPTRVRLGMRGGSIPEDGDVVEMSWGLDFIRHWRRVFETQLRPVLVPWAKTAPDTDY
jgi:hypothetical protein